jgi:3-methyl-2-oxobutanoate hydroxymethyltransferase
MVNRGEKIAILTCYDASFANLCEAAGVDALLVGDSLGMVLQGESSTLPVTLRDMQYHTRCVANGAKNTLIIADMPFGSYQQSPEQALRNATRLMAAGAHMVKLEGGNVMATTIRFLTERGIPVCGHLGFTPQSVHQLGGYRVQGKGAEEARRLLDDAKALEDAGASMLVLEMVPAALAMEVSALLDIPTIGIGAGVDCDGQVLVLHDMLGIYPGKTPRFARNFLESSGNVQEALSAYVQAVKNLSFPTAAHSF